MARGKFAFVIPKTVSASGAKKVEDELGKKRVKPLGKGNVLVVPWSSAARTVLQSSQNISSFHTDKIPPAKIGGLPASEARIAKVWNWNIETRGVQVTTAQVEKFWKSLGLKMVGNKMNDDIDRKSLGEVRSGEKHVGKGNWSLWQTWGWSIVPGWFGWWEKLSCYSRTFKASGFGGALEAVDQISAQVSGTHHYAYQTRTTSPTAYAEDWTYIWVGEKRGGVAYSYARKGSTVRQITSSYIWPHL